MTMFNTTRLCAEVRAVHWRDKIVGEFHLSHTIYGVLQMEDCSNNAHLAAAGAVIPAFTGANFRQIGASNKKVSQHTLTQRWRNSGNWIVHGSLPEALTSIKHTVLLAVKDPGLRWQPRRVHHARVV